jgi:hypothetical protein
MTVFSDSSGFILDIAAFSDSSSVSLDIAAFSDSSSVMISFFLFSEFTYLPLPTLIRVIFSSNVSKERPIEVLGTIRSQPKSVPQSKTYLIGSN